MLAVKNSHSSTVSTTDPIPNRMLLQGRRLVLASNRGPLEFQWGESGRLQTSRGSGGVVTALEAIGHRVRLSWVASAMTDADRTVARSGIGDGLSPLADDMDVRLRFVVPSKREYNLYYNVFANPVLWFVQHGLAGLLPQTDFIETVEEAWHHGYVPVNRAFAEAVLGELALRDVAPVVLLQDYQLYLAAGYIRQRAPWAMIQQFVHISWPEPNGWQALPFPIVRAICRGLLANDIVGFQTPRDAANFAATCAEYVPEARVDEAGESIACGNRRTLIRSYPISIDVEALSRMADSPEVWRLERQVLPLCGKKTIVRIDRLDPSKNVLVGFKAYRSLLERRPDLRGDVKFLAFLVPSRTAIPEYKRYANEVFAEVEAINTRFGQDGWRPIEVFYQNNMAHAVAAMRHYDVLLVNSVVDGMNLVSKEGPTVNKRDGVLVLSEGAGSYAELHRYALNVRPLDVDGTSRALESALQMPAAERRELARRLRQAVAANDISDWLGHQLKDIAHLREPKTIQTKSIPCCPALEAAV